MRVGRGSQDAAVALVHGGADLLAQDLDNHTAAQLAEWCALNPAP